MTHDKSWSYDGDHDHDGAGDFFLSLYYYLVSWPQQPLSRFIGKV